ncbi:hypothetical protein ACTXT7_010110 [Hymenolepis weldensis]
MEKKELILDSFTENKEETWRYEKKTGVYKWCAGKQRSTIDQTSTYGLEVYITVLDGLLKISLQLRDSVGAFKVVCASSTGKHNEYDDREFEAVCVSSTVDHGRYNGWDSEAICGVASGDH